MKSKNIKNRTIEDYIILGYKPKKIALLKKISSLKDINGFCLPY